MHRSEQYRNNNDLQVEDAVNTLKDYGHKIKWTPNARIADVGSADGTVTNALKKFIPVNYQSIVGFDISPNMVRTATKTFADEKTVFKVFNIDDEPTTDMKGAFDHVFAFNLLHWTRDSEIALKHLYQMMDEGGTGLFTALSYAAIFDIYRILARRPKWEGWIKEILPKFQSPYMHIKNPEKKIADQMRRVGFKNIETECKPYTFVFNDWGSLREAIIPVVGFPLPEDIFKELIDDIVELARDLVVLDIKNNDYYSGKININVEKVVAYGTK